MSETVSSNLNKASRPRGSQSNDIEAIDTSNPFPQNGGPILRGSAPRPKKRGGKKTSRQTPSRHPEPSQASDVSADNRDETESSENESTVSHGDSLVRKSRRKARASDTRTSQAAGRDDDSKSGRKPMTQPQEVSWLSQIAADGYGLIRLALTLPKATYPIWKWGLFAYLVCLGISYLLAYLYHFAADTLSPVCAIPVIGSQIPFCTGPLEFKDGSVDASKVATSQEELTVVMDRVGQNFDLARDIVAHEFTLRDLRIRVVASNLARKHEIAQELDSLIRLTKRTAK